MSLFELKSSTTPYRSWQYATKAISYYIDEIFYPDGRIRIRVFWPLRDPAYPHDAVSGYADFDALDEAVEAVKADCARRALEALPS
jgi:hypothetical protein